MGSGESAGLEAEAEEVASRLGLKIVTFGLLREPGGRPRRGGSLVKSSYSPFCKVRPRGSKCPGQCWCLCGFSDKLFTLTGMAQLA